jgi:hypothetical protein
LVIGRLDIHHSAIFLALVEAMRTLAVAKLGIVALCACSCGLGAGNGAGASIGKAQDQGSGRSHYGRPVAPSIGGAELSVSAMPSHWRRGAPGFAIRITYRNAPAGAGLTIGIVRDIANLRNLPASGGGLTAMPVPIEGNGVEEVRFEGTGFLAPADAPDRFPVRAGRHIFIANMLNHRHGVIGMVRRDRDDRILAEARSEPITIDDRE